MDSGHPEAFSMKQDRGASLWHLHPNLSERVLVAEDLPVHSLFRLLTRERLVDPRGRELC